MPENTTDRLVLEVNRTHAEGAIQVVLSQVDAKGTGWGYRLAGPKHYNSGATPLLSSDLTERDATELRSMLDAVFPVQLSDNEVREMVAELDGRARVIAAHLAAEVLRLRASLAYIEAQDTSRA